MDKKQKILAIVGPTASGKTALSIALAKRFSGEIISADSRQVYCGFDVATVKVTPEEMDGIHHHLLDISDISARVSVVEYKEKALAAIGEIANRGHIPIVCGGTGYYIDAVLYDRTFPEVPDNDVLRNELAGKSPTELFTLLESLDPVRALSIEKENPRRLIRAIEIATALGKVPEADVSYESAFDVLTIGLKPSDEVLRSRIQKRIETRLDDMIDEIKTAHESGALTPERASELGFDFSLTLQFLDSVITKEELAKRLEYGDWQLAKRQARWLKRNPKITWFETADIESANLIVSEWVSKN